MFQLLLLLVSALCVSGIRTRMHMVLQASPDQNCSAWLNTSAGQQFVTCDTGNPGGPIPLAQSNCSLSSSDFDSYCNDPCFATLSKAYDFFLSTGTCLPVYQDKYKPCVTDADCPTLGDGLARMCYQSYCYHACNTTADCNSCLGETCATLGQSKGCISSEMYFVNGSAAANRTIQNAFRGMVYAFKAGCSKSTNGTYCSLIDLTNQTCASLTSTWGCCASTILPSMKYCEWTNYSDPSLSNLLNCNFAQAPCGGLPLASQYCEFNISASSISNGSSTSSSSTSSSSTSSSGTSSSGSASGSKSGSASGSGSGSASTSSSSSGLVGSSPSSGITGVSSPSSAITGVSSGSSPSSPLISGHSGSGSGSGSGVHTGGNGTVGTGGSGAPGQAAISWSLTAALVVAACVHIIS